MAFREFLHTPATQWIPTDCLRLIRDYVPATIQERCFMCGDAVVLVDKMGRLFFKDRIACSEYIVLCAECFESSYE